jgi:ABC-type antimicrobial peptide transport system permease subunit
VLLGVFGALALLVMTVGVYGVIAFMTTRRLPELGVRLALGATRGEIQRVVLRDALAMTIGGIAVGVAAALALGRFIENQLYGVTPTDQPTFAAAAVLVLLAVLLACWRPARRASRLDPIAVLRAE